MLVQFYAKNQPHFCSHAAPIYHALPPDIRGPFYARGHAAIRCAELGIAPVWPPPRFSQRDTVLVASFEDYRSVRPAKVIFLNHGAAQTYIGTAERHPAYSGGTDRDRTVLFLEPSERAATISRTAYPDIPAVACGVCYLDGFINNPPTYDPTLVAISFHADVSIVEETRSAFTHYRSAIVDMARSGTFNLLGHSHPRAQSQMQMFWEQIGVPYEPDWSKVLQRGGVFVVDNSSAGFEFTATGRPTVWLNAPWYRRDVYHGLRFWDLVPGPQVDTPEMLALTIEQTIRRPDAGLAARQRIIEQVYDGGVLDGRATERAVAAIVQLSGLSIPSASS